MAKTCEELFSSLDATIIGNPDEIVSGIAYNSANVSEGDAFFCIVGFKTDGHSYAQSAIDKGARVIVAERRLYLADATDVTVVIVPDSRKAMALAACAFYDNPSKDFMLVGVTGTNGKTTTTYLVEAIARHAGYKTGVIGTTGTRIGDEFIETSHTTPESPDLQKTFAMMRDAGCEVVAMEVSSHALDLMRTLGTDFDVTCFTNLTQDHLDYHHTFEAYFEAKAILFSDVYPAKRVIGLGDKWGIELYKRCAEIGEYVVTTGFDSKCDIHPIDISFGIKGTDIELDICGDNECFRYPLVGRFNVENVMTAIGASVQLGIPNETAIDALKASCRVPGRLELVPESIDENYSVYVDYAHTPDALEKAISALSELGSGKLIVVFGCGGDRDATKRPIMGAVALSADHAIVTSDNPRTEDPNSIIADIVAGMEDGGKDACTIESGPFEIIPNRRDAILRAVCMAQDQDVILLAGKGHEDYQIIGKKKTHFDDREEAAWAINQRKEGKCASEPSAQDANVGGN